MIEWLQSVLSPIQLIGYAGMICAVCSFQCRKNRNFFILLSLCGTFFAIQYALLGGWAGCLSNIFAILRGLVLAGGERWHKKPVLWGLVTAFALSAILAVVVFHDPWYIGLLLFIAQAGGTFAMWTDDGKTIRLFQFCISSPIWLYHNIFYAFSLGGILCESFNMLSVLVSFIRFRRTGFEGRQPTGK